MTGYFLNQVVYILLVIIEIIESIWWGTDTFINYTYI